MINRHFTNVWPIFKAKSDCWGSWSSRRHFETVASGPCQFIVYFIAGKKLGVRSQKIIMILIIYRRRLWSGLLDCGEPKWISHFLAPFLVNWLRENYVHEWMCLSSINVITFWWLHRPKVNRRRVDEHRRLGRVYPLRTRLPLRFRLTVQKIDETHVIRQQVSFEPYCVIFRERGGLNFFQGN